MVIPPHPTYLLPSTPACHNHYAGACGHVQVQVLRQVHMFRQVLRRVQVQV